MGRRTDYGLMGHTVTDRWGNPIISAGVFGTPLRAKWFALFKLNELTKGTPMTPRAVAPIWRRVSRAKQLELRYVMTRRHA